jgi:CheY-like chemotaxis protein
MPYKAQCVLVLEDNPVQSALYGKILAAGGYEVMAICDPLDLVNNLSGLTVPDAILLDIVMPGMDGVVVLQHLERDARWCVPPVIMMTASPTKDRVVAANQVPVPPEGFLAKPVEPQAMLQLVHTVIASQEPAYLLRQLQRKRLSMKLGLQDVIERLSSETRENKDAQATHEKLLADTRREIQSLQAVRTQFRDAPPETQLALQRQMEELEETCLQHRSGIQEAEARHKKIIHLRQDILYKQKTIRDLDHRIEALAQALK